MIQVEHVTRRFGELVAVDDVTFSIGPGEIVGFLGPNGAGKSTLLRMLATYLEPCAGTLRIAGLDARTQALAVREKIGYLPEHNPLFEAMRSRRFLDFLGRVRGLTREERARRIGWCSERLGLAAVLDRPIRECSKGYRQRIGLAGALLHDPPVLLLDEPTHGLDPLQVVAFREFLHEIAQGRAVLFSSHILAEVATISSRLLVVQRGSLILDGQVPELAARAKQEHTDLEGLVVHAIRERGGRVELA
ncbi:MAG: ATP-binding cassette domain-containing protein [Planctomycetes bacterium]|nr:ATP-binding cassette domain-containing protein [Planctomycetota bacterium]